MTVLPALKLVVIRSEDIQRSARFYSHIGLEFAIHKHGSQPEHLAAEFGGATTGGGIFEIYPATESHGVTRSVRLGFAVESFEEVLSVIGEHGGKVLTKPYDSEWGRRAVVSDPDGHRVELYPADEPQA